MLRWLTLLLVMSCARTPTESLPEGPRGQQGTPRAGRPLDLRVPMRDGVRLFTRVHVPRGAGPWPAVLMRAPYPMGEVLDARCAELTRHGYACVWQSTRGRGASQGAWEPFVHERPDGRDTLAWLVQQPWQDGNLALMGESYLGAVQWAVADVLPPQVKTIIPSVIGTDLYLSAYEHGLFRHEILTAWMTMMADRGFHPLRGDRYQAALDHRPRRTMDLVAAGHEVPWFRTWVTNPSPDDAPWQTPVARKGAEAPAATSVPVLMMGGWYDAFTGPQLEAWSQLATRSRSTLVMGPWNHLGKVASDVPLRGVTLDGMDAPTMGQIPRVLDWLDHHLKGLPARFPVGATLTYVAGGDRWETREAWPPPTKDLVLHPQPGGDAVGCRAALGPSPGSGTVSYVYDPADPTPSLGGAGLLAGTLPGWKGVKPGLRDQGDLCARRRDLVGFRSAPLDEPVHVAGAIGMTLTVSTDAPDTAFGFRVVELRPDGKALHVREAITSLSAAAREAGRAPPRPGEVVTLTLQTWPTEHEFAAGSRILLEVGSASFPKYEAHANVAGPWADAATTQPANQTLHLGPTSLTLPQVVRRR